MNCYREEKWLLRHCVILLCLFLTSCSKRPTTDISSFSSVIQDSAKDALVLDAIIRQEAMLVNVPLPLYNERILPSYHHDSENGTISLGYRSSLLPHQIIEFFLNQMERYGWKHTVSFEGFDTLLHFENPDSYCTILVQTERTVSSIFIYIKRASI